MRLSRDGPATVKESRMSLFPRFIYVSQQLAADDVTVWIRLSSNVCHSRQGGSMFGGKTYAKEIDGWRVTWESLGGYRFWCRQEHPGNSRIAAVVMLNPGSLSEDGEGLSRDTTLRVLRKIFDGTSYNPFVINLFNFSAPKPDAFFAAWEHRDHSAFNYAGLPKSEFSAVMYAYGDYENGTYYPLEIKKRIADIRAFLCGVPEIDVPRNQSGTPKHPLPVQRQGLKDKFRQAIIKHASANNSLQTTSLSEHA